MALLEIDNEGLLSCKPHNMCRPFIGVVDKNSKIRWTSSKQNLGRSSIDFYPENIRAAVLERFSQCIVLEQPTSFIAHAFDGPEEPRRLPFDFRELAAVVLASILPVGYSALSDDDLSVLQLMSEDKALKDIAHEMNRSKSAIDARIKSVKTKLGCETIGGLVALALTNSMI